MEQISVETADCVIRHMNAFIRQCHEERAADFGEPCAYCRHSESCGYDWLARMQPLLDVSNEEIQLAYRK